MLEMQIVTFPPRPDELETVEVFNKMMILMHFQRWQLLLQEVNTYHHPFKYIHACMYVDKYIK